MSDPSGKLGTVTELVWGCLDTPVGRISVACTASGVARVKYGDPAEAADSARRKRLRQEPAVLARGDDPPEPPDAAAAPALAEPSDGAAGALLSTALGELAEYFAGQRKSFTVPVDLSGTSGARRTVLSVLYESVGFGETITYGGLAGRSGLTDDGQSPPARVVGQVMASNPIAVIVPCHRVVAGNGLGGYSGGSGTDIKQWLLILEGALPATLDWDPSGVHWGYSANSPSVGASAPGP